MEKQIQSRWKSKAAIMSLVTLGLFVAKTYFNVEIPEVDRLIDLVLIAGTSWGIFNDPTNKDGY